MQKQLYELQRVKHLYDDTMEVINELEDHFNNVNRQAEEARNILIPPQQPNIINLDDVSSSIEIINTLPPAIVANMEAEEQHEMVRLLLDLPPNETERVLNELNDTFSRSYHDELPKDLKDLIVEEHPPTSPDEPQRSRQPMSLNAPNDSPVRPAANPHWTYDTDDDTTFTPVKTPPAKRPAPHHQDKCRRASSHPKSEHPEERLILMRMNRLKLMILQIAVGLELAQVHAMVVTWPCMMIDQILMMMQDIKPHLQILPDPCTPKEQEKP